MCPGQPQIQSCVQEVKTAHLADKPLNLNSRRGNGYWVLCQIEQRIQKRDFRVSHSPHCMHIAEEDEETRGSSKRNCLESNPEHSAEVMGLPVRIG